MLLARAPTWSGSRSINRSAITELKGLRRTSDEMRDSHNEFMWTSTEQSRHDSEMYFFTIDIIRWRHVLAKYLQSSAPSSLGDRIRVRKSKVDVPFEPTDCLGSFARRVFMSSSPTSVTVRTLVAGVTTEAMPFQPCGAKKSPRGSHYCSHEAARSRVAIRSLKSHRSTQSVSYRVTFSTVSVAARCSAKRNLR
jgi:hypothetical protein